MARTFAPARRDDAPNDASRAEDGTITGGASPQVKAVRTAGRPAPTKRGTTKVGTLASRHRQLPRRKVWPMWMTALVQAGLFVAFVVLWEVGARTGVVDSFFWSQPSKIFATFLKFVGSGNAVVDTLATFRSTIIGFVLGTLSGGMLGLSFWWSRNYANVAQPYLICFEAMPKLALAPLVVLVFGMGITANVAIGVALTIVVSTLTTYAGVKAVDWDSERLFYSLGATRAQVFRKLVVPSVLPWIISVLRVNIGLALTGTIVGEFISSQHGLGRLILYAGETYDIALIWVGVAVLSTLSIVMYVAVARLEKVLIKGVTHGASA